MVAVENRLTAYDNCLAVRQAARRVTQFYARAVELSGRSQAIAATIGERAAEDRSRRRIAFPAPYAQS